VSAKPQDLPLLAVSKGKSIQTDMIGAQVAVLMLWAGFGERQRSRRGPVSHDFLDLLSSARVEALVQFDRDQA
jgi:hypothetical protein